MQWNYLWFLPHTLNMKRHSGVAKPRPTLAWARVSVSGNSWTSRSRSIAICKWCSFLCFLNLTFARLVFNTGEDLYCMHITAYIIVAHMGDQFSNISGAHIGTKCLAQKFPVGMPPDPPSYCKLTHTPTTQLPQCDVSLYVSLSRPADHHH